MITAKKANGQSLIEFALLAPVLFFLVMGLFDIGRAVFYFAVLNTAAREGSRFAVVQPDCAYKSDPVRCSGGYVESYPLDCAYALSTPNLSVCNVIRERLFDIGELSNSTVTINHGLSAASSPVITIDIDFLFHPITPGLSLISDFHIHASSEMLKTQVALP